MINIGKDYAITSDAYNIVVNRIVVNQKTKASVLRAVGYFATMKNALDWLVDNEVKATELKDLQAVVAKQDELYQLIAGLKLVGVKL